MPPTGHVRTPDLIRAQRPLAVALVALSVTAAAVGLLQPALMGAFIADVSAGAPYSTSLLAIVAVLAVGTVVSGGASYLTARFTEVGALGLRRQVVGALLRSPITRLHRRSAAELASRVVNDPPVLMAGATSVLAQGVAALLTCVGATIASIVIMPRAFGLAMSCATLALVLTALLGMRARNRRRHVQEATSALSETVQTVLDGIVMIRHYDVTDRFEQQIDDGLVSLNRRTLRLATTHATLGPVTELVLKAALVIALLSAAADVATGRASLASLVAFIMYFQMTTTGLQEVLSSYVALKEAEAGRERIEEIAQAQADPSSRARARVGGPDTALPDGTAARFDDVSFAYGTLTVLDHVSFTIPTGSVTAVVGPSGAGKTTIINLLERFIEPAGGTFISAESTHPAATSGFVDQGATVVRGSVADNVRFARDGISDEQIAETLRRVGLPTLASRTGLRTQISPRGSSLSGGERQRIALARALVSAPRTLVLDEPTSNVDGVLEQHMLDAVDELAPGATVIVVAHRPSTVRRADHLVFLNHSVVQEQGAPQDCLERNRDLREVLGEWEMNR